MTKRNLGRKNASKDIKTIRALNKYPDSAVACRVYRAAAFTHNSSGDYLPITFDSERRDAKAMHSTVTNNTRITVPIPGWYYIWGNAVFDANATGSRVLQIRVGGSTAIAAVREIAPSASANSKMAISTVYYLNADDYVELYAYQNSGGNLDIITEGTYSPDFAAAKFPFNDVPRGIGTSIPV